MAREAEGVRLETIAVVDLQAPHQRAAAVQQIRVAAAVPGMQVTEPKQMTMPSSIPGKPTTGWGVYASMSGAWDPALGLGDVAARFRAACRHKLPTGIRLASVAVGPARADLEHAPAPSSKAYVGFAGTLLHPPRTTEAQLASFRRLLEGQAGLTVWRVEDGVSSGDMRIKIVRGEVRADAAATAEALEALVGVAIEDASKKSGVSYPQVERDPLTGADAAVVVMISSSPVLRAWAAPTSTQPSSRTQRPTQGASFFKPSLS